MLEGKAGQACDGVGGSAGPGMVGVWSASIAVNSVVQRPGHIAAALVQYHAERVPAVHQASDHYGATALPLLAAATAAASSAPA